MTSREALEKIDLIINYSNFINDELKSYFECVKIIKKDLDMLEFIRTHYEMNGFNELIPKYDEVDKFNELERWLK